MNDEDLRSLLQQVPYESLRAYLETNSVPLPADSNKDKLIDFMLTTPEFKKDARAAALIELTAATRLFTKDLKNSAEKLVGLSTEVAKVHSSAEGLKNIFIVLSLIMGMITMFGGMKLTTLQSDAARAQEQLESGEKIIEGYRSFMLSSVSKSVSSTMNQVSSRWFTEADVPVADELSMYIKNLENLRGIGGTSSDNTNARQEGMLILEFLCQLEPIARSPYSEADIGNNQFRAAEEKWESLQQDWNEALNNGSVPAETAKTYLAYISNIRGVFSHARFRAVDIRRDPEGAMLYIRQAKQYFENAREFRRTYAPALSNLGVTLLDELELKMRTPENIVIRSELDLPDVVLNEAKNVRQLPVKVRSRIYNNLAMSALLKAVFFSSNNELQNARRQLLKADENLDMAMKIPEASTMVILSKAEISAYRAVINNQANIDSSHAINGIKSWIQEALVKEFPFASEEETVTGSLAFSAFREKFPDESNSIWALVYRRHSLSQINSPEF
ncbi:MAG: hypothetical protein B0W54_01330 [Cellvibrio sp. 79]|nr:MAG: hypothetical protein B0W54_01330 [Cellvibrio sp. 79]